jgi:hypothetical protein
MSPRARLKRVVGPALLTRGSDLARGRTDIYFHSNGTPDISRSLYSALRFSGLWEHIAICLCAAVRTSENLTLKIKTTNSHTP